MLYVMMPSNALSFLSHAFMLVKHVVHACLWQDCLSPSLLVPWSAVLGLDEKSIHFPEGLCQLTQLQELRANVADNPFNIRLLFSVPAAFSQLRELRRLEMSCLHLQEVPAAMTGAVAMARCRVFNRAFFRCF